MTTLEMKCILMLAETLNFSKAAQELNITQPAFSRMIARAEEELGFKLFTRNTREVKVSREGEAFILSLRQAAAIYKSGIDFSLNMLRKDNSLEIVCAAEFICLELAPHILEFRKKRPSLFVECTPVATERVPDRLRNKQADIGFIFTNQDHFSSDFASKVISKVPLHVVVNRENPLAKKETLHAADLEAEKFIVLQTNIGTYEIGTYGTPLVILNRKFGTHLKESSIVETTQACLLQVACNQGICFLTSWLPHLVPPNCVMKKLEGVEFNFTALWNKGGISKWAHMFLTGLDDLNKN